MNADSEPTSRGISVRRDQRITLRQSNPLVARGLRDVVQLVAPNVGELLARAYGLFRRGDYDAAIADCTEAIRLNPKYAAAYYNRGLVHRYKGDLDNAIADYTEAIRLDPLNPKMVVVYDLRGDAYEAKGDYDSVIANYTEAIRLHPKCAAAYHQRGLAYQAKGDRAKAAADFGKARELRYKP